MQDHQGLINSTHMADLSFSADAVTLRKPFENSILYYIGPICMVGCNYALSMVSYGDFLFFFLFFFFFNIFLSIYQCPVA